MARFTPGEAVEHNGRPATVAAVTQLNGHTRYSIFYTDDQGGANFDLLGRVISKVAR